jgi:hypothetical protein
LVTCLAIPAVHGQDAVDETLGVGDIRLAAPLSTVPFPCPDPIVCEGQYAAAWIRVWHGDGVIQRIDIVYSGKKTGSQEEISFHPITLAQAIKTHSIWNGRRVPRLGFASDEGSLRMIVDYANGVAYFSNGATAGSIVSEVHYLPVTDPEVRSASSSPLSEQGRWLVKAAWTAERYRNSQTEGKPPAPKADSEEMQFTRQKLALQLEKMSQSLSGYAKTALMLSEHLSESLKKNEKPDADVSDKLKKAFACLTESTHEALDLISENPGLVRLEDVEALPLDLAAQAEERMNELIEQGFLN